MKIPTADVTFAGASFSPSRKLSVEAVGIDRITGATAADSGKRVRAITAAPVQAIRSSLRQLSVYTAVVAFNIAIPASQFPNAASPSDIYTAVTSSLSSAVASGSFTMAVTTAAASANITALTYVTVTSATASAPIIVAPPSFTPTKAPNQAQTHTRNQTKKMLLLLLLLLVLLFGLIAVGARRILMSASGSGDGPRGGYFTFLDVYRSVPRDPAGSPADADAPISTTAPPTAASEPASSTAAAATAPTASI